MNFPTSYPTGVDFISHSSEQSAVCQRKQFTEFCGSSGWETIQPECVFVRDEGQRRRRLGLLSPLSETVEPCVRGRLKNRSVPPTLSEGMRGGGGRLSISTPLIGLNYVLQIVVFDVPRFTLSVPLFLNVCPCVFMCVSISSAAIVSSEQNPVIIIAVVAVAGTIILVFMVFGFIIGRRYALAGPIDSPLL